jgi:hypothetical protein
MWNADVASARASWTEAERTEHRGNREPERDRCALASHLLFFHLFLILARERVREREREKERERKRESEMEREKREREKERE